MRYLIVCLFLVGCSQPMESESDPCADIAGRLADSVLMLRTASAEPDPDAVDRAEDLAIEYNRCTRFPSET